MKRKTIGKIILALIFAFFIGITVWCFGWKEGIIMWAIGTCVSAIIIIAMFLVTEDDNDTMH